MGEPPSSNLIARELARLPRYLYASPRYIERSGEPGKPADLMQHECVRLNPADVNGWTLHRQKEIAEVAVSGRFLLNSVGMIRCLATLDLGIAVLAEEIAAEDVAAGRLRRVMTEWQASAMPVYAITETRLLPAKTQRFIEFLREKLGGPATLPQQGT
jgi:DNA-binding transcriptional LysR family regulator